MLPVYPIPEPFIQDEFGHLLVADTLASGRLANPPHPMREHFESIYVLQDPTYASYFPPGTGFALAPAILVGIAPWFGVWFSVGLMCASIYWMLAGAMPGRWALLGGLLAGARFGVISHWMNSYWGGAVPAIGGALAIGALLRFFREDRRSYALVLGFGLIVLSQTRPYEGFLLSIPVLGAVLVVVVRRTQTNWRIRLTGTILPLLGMLLIGGAMTAYYNWRVTGDPWQLPYQLYQKQYGVPQSFYWQAPRPPANSTRFADLTGVYRWQFDNYQAGKSWPGFAAVTMRKLKMFWDFFFQPVWSIPLLALPWIWQNLRLRFLLIVCLFVIMGVAAYPFFFPHYLAPISGVLLLVVMEGIRRVKLWQWRKRPVGAAVAVGILAVSATAVAIAPATPVHNILNTGTPRARILKALGRYPGKHLIFVRYGPEHSFQYSVVNNAADMETARIVWARDLGAGKNAELVRYFPDRTLWTFEADKAPVRLMPYNRQDAAPGAPR